MQPQPSPEVRYRLHDVSATSPLNPEIVAINRYWPNSDFTRSKLAAVDFSGSHLVGAQFRSAVLRSAVFAGCDLRGANLSFADLYGTHFRANVIGDRTVQTNISGADFSSAKHLSPRLEWYNTSDITLGEVMATAGEVEGLRLVRIHARDGQQRAVTDGRLRCYGGDRTSYTLSGAVEGVNGVKGVARYEAELMLYQT